MKTFYSDDHRGHAGAKEFHLGEMVPIHEKPARLDMVLDRLRASGLGEIAPPKSFGNEAILAVHAADYVGFLAEAWDLWVAEDSAAGEFALPFTFAGRGMSQRIPRSIHGKLGHYAFDLAVPFLPGTWRAIRSAVDVALTGQQEVAGGARAAFSLCRPPGHHAMADMAGGYCYLNNAAIAAQAFRDQGAAKVAVLDVDYHHGNGTQSIFYGRPDVLFVSLHGDPEQEYPYYLGYADEIGANAHAQILQTVSPGDLAQQREMQRWFLVDRRNTHQPGNRQPVLVTAGGDESIGVFRRDTCLLRLAAGIDLYEAGRPAAGLFHLAGQRRSQFRPVNSLDHIEQTDRLFHLVGL